MWHLRLAASTAFVALAAAEASSKRGLCYVPAAQTPSDDQLWTDTPGSDLTWYYNYKAEPSDAYKVNKNIQFVPMLWGASDSDQGTPFLDSVKDQIANGANVSYVLGFNEPDGAHDTGGSNIPADLAAQTWIKQIEPLKKMGVKLGAPAVTGSPNGFTWLENWLQACDGGCNPDFIPVHWYGNFDGIASHVGQVVDAYPNLTVWVTEWGFSDQDLEATQSFYNQTVAMFDRWTNITHYSYFGAFRSDVSNVGPNAAMLTEQGKLTDIGSWYLGGAATNNVPQSDASHISTGTLLCLTILAACMIAVV